MRKVFNNLSVYVRHEDIETAESFVVNDPYVKLGLPSPAADDIFNFTEYWAFGVEWGKGSRCYAAEFSRSSDVYDQLNKAGLSYITSSSNTGSFCQWVYINGVFAYEVYKSRQADRYDDIPSEFLAEKGYVPCEEEFRAWQAEKPVDENFAF